MVFYPDETSRPYAAIVYISVTFADGSTNRGSGAVVGPNDILTASHVVGRGSLAPVDIDIYPAYNGRPSSVFPSFTAGRFQVDRLPVDEDRDGFLFRSEAAFDFAVIGISQRIGDQTGTFGLRASAGSGDYRVLGFSGGQSGRLAGDTGAVAQTAVFDISDLFHTPGSSGGPLIDGSNQIVGVISTASWGARIDDEAFQIQSWIAGNDGLLADDRPPGPDDGSETLTGTTGNDTFSGMGGDDRVDGGPGRDTATYRGSRDGYAVTSTADGVTVTDSMAGRDGRDTLLNVERVRFADGVLAFDTGASTGGPATAGEVYRLYQAAFDRTPDLAGLSNNVRVADAGLSLRAEAAAFVVSGEFRTLYGETASDTTFVTALYQNVLNRAPDQAGLNGWLAALSSGSQDRAGVLIGFSESNENRALTQAAIQNGILLDLSVVG